MVLQKLNEVESAVRAELEMWFCAGCSRFHLQAESVLLTFEADEFARFMNRTVDCYSTNISLKEAQYIH